MQKFLSVSAALIGFGALSASALPVLAQSGPTINITSPQEGATVSGDKVISSWESAGVTIVPGSKATKQEEAHFHVFINREDFKAGVEIPREMDKEGIIHTGNNSHEIIGLSPGTHKVTLVLGYAKHQPWEPLVTDTVSFNVE